MHPPLQALADRLPPEAIVTDLDLMQGYRRDEAALVPAGTPLAVVRARDVEDVGATLAWANSAGVPVVPRGAGTGLSGGANAIDGCVVLSLERMTAIREIDTADRFAVVEPGVVNADLGRAAAARGLFYPPDPGSFETCTIGGNVATNAGGMRCVKYGVTRESVLGLEAVLADGSVLDTGARTIKNVAGYDLTSLLVGSEGTLGVITSITLRLRPLPARHPITFVATFPTLPAVALAISGIVSEGLTLRLLELMDNETINAVENYRRFDLDRTAAAVLIGQADGKDADGEVDAALRHCRDAGAGLAIRADTAQESDLLLEARRAAGTALIGTGPTIIEDVAVPLSRQAEMLTAIADISRDLGLRIATTGHVGDGNLHPVLLLPDLSASTRDRAMAAAELLCARAVALGGTITGEHGVGALKRPWLAQQLSPVAQRVHRAVKAALDPNGILNPGRGF